MASSRKRPPKPDPADGALLSALQRAVAQAAPSAADPMAAVPARALGRPRAGAPPPPAAPLVIAFSGGPDSTVLLDLCCRLRDQRAPGFAQLRAVHVHHRLQPQADGWVAHCAEQCRLRSVELTVCRVRVARARGLEAGARQARYG